VLLPIGKGKKDDKAKKGSIFTLFNLKAYSLLLRRAILHKVKTRKKGADSIESVKNKALTQGQQQMRKHGELEVDSKGNLKENGV